MNQKIYFCKSQFKNIFLQAQTGVLIKVGKTFLIKSIHSCGPTGWPAMIEATNALRHMILVIPAFFQIGIQLVAIFLSFPERHRIAFDFMVRIAIIILPTNRSYARVIGLASIVA